MSDSGQASVDRLLGFIVVVVAVLVVVPTAFGFAGVDLKNASLGNGDDSGPADGPIVVLATYGTAIDDQRTSVGAVEVLVTTGGPEVDMSQVTVSWENGGSYELTPAGTDVGDASYALSVLDGEQVLQESGDRALLRFDPGTDDVEGAGSFGERLQPGQTITLTLTTADGQTTTVTVTVPSPLPDRSAVRFR